MPESTSRAVWSGGHSRFSVRLMTLAAAIPVVTFGVSLAGFIDQHLARQALTALAGGGTVALVIAVLLAIAMARSVARRQEAERRLLVLEAQATEERRLTDIAANFPGIIYRHVLSPDGRATYPYVSNGHDLPLRAGEMGPLAHFAEQLFHPADRDRWRAAVEDSARTLAPFHCEVRLVSGDRWVRSAASPRRGPDGSVVWDGVLLDITDLKQAEEALKRSLAEKEMMLREIHHRVRNNLQVVSSLIQIEAFQITDPEARQRIGEVSRRIGALGHLHEQLYAATDFASIDCSEHLRRLCLNLMQPYFLRGLSLGTNVQALRCNLDTAIPLGLIAHELLHEAAERLVHSQTAGQILVTLLRDGPAVVLAVRGAGAADAAVPGVGHRILHALADQLDAHISHGGDGAAVRIGGERFHDADILGRDDFAQ